VHGRPGGPLGSVRLALIRTQGEGEKSNWLLHRMKTDAAGGVQADGRAAVAGEQADAQADPHVEAQGDPHVDAQADPHVDDGAQGADEAADAVPLPSRRQLQPMLSTPATPTLARSTAARWGTWAEVKWDGIRALGVWDGHRLRLFARSGTEITARYPEVLTAGLDAASAVVDGEIIALDASGRPSFTRLQNRMHLTKPRQIEAERTRTPVRYHLFDVLACDGEDLAARPLSERRALLERIAAAPGEPVAVPPVFDDVDAALSTSRRFALEGIVVKNPASTYRRGIRSPDWLKVKLTRTQEVVIGGIRPGRGGRTGVIGSLLVGIPGPDGLRYAGRVGTGFSESTLARLDDVLQPLRTDDDPFVGVPDADARDALWVRPDLVGEVEFAEFTPGGILRQSRWRGLRPDKAPSDVRRES
jgi:bifunctional non-homologous end joining protein LigD